MGCGGSGQRQTNNEVKHIFADITAIANESGDPTDHNENVQLHEGVKETCTEIGETGVKFWFVTGLKLDDCLQTFQDTGLFSADTLALKIEESDTSRLAEAFQEIITKQTEHRDSGNAENVLIVHGAIIHKLEEEYNPDAKSLFLELTSKSTVVISYRMAPKSKGFLVELIKKGSPADSTLTIGNGTNSLPMLLKAHIRVTKTPFSGADMSKIILYSISDFRHLKDMLNSKGRKNHVKK